MLYREVEYVLYRQVRDADLKSVREYVAANPYETDIVNDTHLTEARQIPPPSLGNISVVLTFMPLVTDFPALNYVFFP